MFTVNCWGTIFEEIRTRKVQNNLYCEFGGLNEGRENIIICNYIKKICRYLNTCFCMFIHMTILPFKKNNFMRKEQLSTQRSMCWYWWEWYPQAHVFEKYWMGALFGKMVQPCLRKYVTKGRLGEFVASSHFQFSLPHTWGWRYDLSASSCHHTCTPQQALVLLKS